MLNLEPNIYSNILLFMTFSIGQFSYIPQIIKALKTKKTADVAILSFIMLSLGYIGLATYAFAFTGDKVFFYLEAIEGSLCILTLVLCIKYQKTTLTSTPT